ncbi:hypothetical protein [Streptomyces sp. NPDC018584]|uniref:hypothetical protein n=1 Tax=unclassified Streptomyces TaxID=2593676 RepID=UPI0037B78DCB
MTFQSDHTLYDPLNPADTATHQMSPTDTARTVWTTRHRGTDAARALTDWQSSTAADGRPLHTARIDCPNAADVLHSFVENHRLAAPQGDQQLPVLDFSVPDRLGCLWLLDGEWIHLWAPDRQTSAAPKPYPMGATPARADALLASARAAATPSSRLPFRRPRSRKDNAA